MSVLGTCGITWLTAQVGIFVCHLWSSRTLDRTSGLDLSSRVLLVHGGRFSEKTAPCRRRLFTQDVLPDQTVLRRRRITPKPARAAPSSANDAGSGTAAATC